MLPTPDIPLVSDSLPIIQLLLFGYAINADPHALPTAVIAGDTGTFARSIVRALENTTYFRVVA